VSIEAILMYLSFMLVSTGLIARLVLLHRRHHIAFLRPYLAYLVASVGFVFLVFIGKLFVHEVFANDHAIEVSAGLILSALACPVFCLHNFFILSWIMALLHRTMNCSLLLAFWFYHACLGILFFLGHAAYQLSSSLGAANAYFFWVEIMGMVAHLSMLGYLVLASVKGPDGTREQFARNLGSIHFALATVFYSVLYSEVLLDWRVSSFYALNLSTYLAGLVIPVWYVARFVTRNPLVLKENHVLPEWQEALSSYQLTTRELEVTAMILEGRTNQEIAERLFIAVKTVKNHVSNIYRKTGVNNRVQLVNLARVGVS